MSLIIVPEVDTWICLPKGIFSLKMSVVVSKFLQYSLLIWKYMDYMYTIWTICNFISVHIYNSKIQ